MKEIIKNSLKTGVVFGIIGAVVGVAAPFLLTTMMGAEAAGDMGLISGAGILQSTLIFGMFGLLEPVIKPLFNFVFGDDTAKGAASPEIAKGQAAQINLIVQQAPQQSQGQLLTTTSHRQKIEAERLALVVADKGIGAP